MASRRSAGPAVLRALRGRHDESRSDDTGGPSTGGSNLALRLPARAMRRQLVFVVLAAAVGGATACRSAQWTDRQPRIPDRLAAMLQGTGSAQALLEHCLDRIAADDRQGAALHAIVCMAESARGEAVAKDSFLRVTGRPCGPLHGIPIVVKDNLDVAGLPTSLGLAVLQDVVPTADAVAVARLRRAGAIVVAKTNLATLARSSRDTVSEVVGRTRNPHSASHTIGGSSGGTAAAVAAGFAVAGLGTDTGASIRGPAMHAGVVGIRPTVGVVPLEGVAPLYAGRDTVGVMARHVVDAALVLAVIADDAELMRAAEAPPIDLRGQRLGVLRFLAAPERSDPVVLEAFERSLADLAALGVELVEISSVLGEQDLQHIPVDRARFVHDLDAFLATRLLDGDPRRQQALTAAGSRVPRGDAATFDGALAAARTRRLRDAYAELFARHRLAACVYPTWSRAAQPIDAGRAPNGDNSGFVCPPLGGPGITVPMGCTASGLPLGLEFAGLPGTDAKLVRLAAAYESVRSSAPLREQMEPPR